MEVARDVPLGNKPGGTDWTLKRRVARQGSRARGTIRPVFSYESLPMLAKVDETDFGEVPS